MHGMYKRRLAGDEVEVDVDCGTYLMKAIAKKPRHDQPPPMFTSPLQTSWPRGWHEDCTDKYEDLVHNLLQAAVNDDQQTIRNLLYKYPRIPNGMEYGESALYVAAFYGKLEAVKILLDSGADVNITSQEIRDFCCSRRGGGRTDLFHMTPLHTAALHGYDQIIMALLEKKADLEIYNDHHETALHLAIKKGHLSTVNLLLRNGANAQALASDGKTALHLAVENAQAQLIDLLVLKKIDINARDRNQQTALHKAAMHDNIGVVQKLLAYDPNIDVADAEGNTPLHLAVQRNDMPMAKLLLQYHPDIGVLNVAGDMPLHIAMRNQDIRLAALLLDCHANAETLIHSPINYHQLRATFLKNAILQGNLELVVLLLSKGADPVRLDAAGRNALFYAITAERGPKPSIIELLAENHIDINSCGNETSLDVAVGCNSPEVAATLIRLGASIRDSACLATAASRGYNEILHLLLNNFHGQEFANEYLEGLKQAAANNHPGTMRLFIDHAGYRDAQNWQEQLTRSLLEAIIRGHYEVAQVYLDHDVPLPQKCLHAAIRSRQEGLVRTLVLQKNVDLSERSTDGLLPEEIATSWPIHNFLTVTMPTTQRLIRAIVQGNYDEFTACLNGGVELIYKDSQGNTPLHHAAIHCRLRMIKDLLGHGANPTMMNNDGMTAVYLAAGKPGCLGIFMHAATPQDIVERRFAETRAVELFNHMIQFDGHVAQKRKIKEQIRRQSKYIGTGLSVLAGGLSAIGLIKQARQHGPKVISKFGIKWTALTALICALLYKKVPQTLNDWRIQQPAALHTIFQDHSPFYDDDDWWWQCSRRRRLMYAPVKVARLIYAPVKIFGEIVTRSLPCACKILCRSICNSWGLCRIRRQVLEDNQRINASEDAFRIQIDRARLQPGFIRGKFNELIQQHPLQTQRAQNMFEQTIGLF
jgi:ankyrin repeat protein